MRPESLKRTEANGGGGGLSHFMGVVQGLNIGGPILSCGVCSLPGMLALWYAVCACGTVVLFCERNRFFSSKKNKKTSNPRLPALHSRARVSRCPVRRSVSTQRMQCYIRRRPFSVLASCSSHFLCRCRGNLPNPQPARQKRETTSELRPRATASGWNLVAQSSRLEPALLCSVAVPRDQ